MYQSLYRKYRPNNFDEVVGQDVVVKTLKNAIKNNKLNHAYLFTGPRGTGKTSIAKILAKTINCENLNDFMPCNKCVSCTQIKNKQTIDIIEIDAASNNGVDEIREIRNKVNLVPSVGQYKVYIIDEVHMLTTGAFNALLKTLEEPPSHIIFILATTEPHKIPMTILSRCQRFDFKKINYLEMSKKLEEIIKLENVDASLDVVKEISILSDGCMRDALSILDQAIAYANSKITVEDIHEINGTIGNEKIKLIIESLIKGNYQETFNIIDECDNKGKNFVKLTEEIILYLRNILITINVPTYFNKTSNSYNEISKLINETKIIEYIEEFNNSISNMKKSNNARIIFEITIIKLMNNNKIKVKENPNFLVSEKSKFKQESKPEIKIVPEEKEQNNEENNKIYNENIQKLIDIRVNNTLCNFDKKQLNSLKQEIDDIRILIINPDYSELASMVLDGTIKAVGKENIIFVFDNERNSMNFNEKCYEIDEMLSQHFNRVYKTIAVDSKEWEKIKKEYNNKTKEYHYQEEIKIDVKKKIEDQTEIETLFDEIIEYK